MTELDEHIDAGATRRSVLLGAGALGAGAILAACGGEQPASDPTTPGAATTSAAGPPPTTEAAEETEPPADDGIKVADVPVGGGLIVAEQQVVVTQPRAGQFKAFNAICTHQMCVVANVSNGKINCTCHGSAFNIGDGSVARGPATRALSPKTVTVNGDSLTIS